MATTKPRITITLDQRTYDVIKAISELGGQSMSAFVSDMLDSALPTLERMAATFQAVNAAQTAERKKFLSSLDRAQAALEPAVMKAVGQVDLFLAAVETAATDSARPADIDPRPVTRGSTPLQNKRNKAPRTSAKPSIGKASIASKAVGKS